LQSDPQPAELFLARLYGSTNDMADLEAMLRVFERQLREGNFNYVDQILTMAVVEKLSPTVLIGMLSITFWGKPELPARVRFAERVYVSLLVRLGEKRAQTLLENRW
jgi:hypothetical protein